MAVDCINHESRECEPGHENNKNQHIQVLETEYRYLSLAQEKLRKHSAEWFFLESKLIAVEKEMDALPIKNTIRSDDEKHHSRTVADDAPLPDRTDSPKAESTSGSEDSQEEDLIDLDTSESSPLGDRPDSPMDESISGFIAKNSVANNVAYDVPREHSKDDDLIDLGLSESNESSENVLDNNSKSVQHLYDNDRLNAAHNQLEEIHRQLAELHKHHTLFMKSQHHSPEPSSPVSTTSSSSSSFSSESGEESPAYRPNRQYSARENYIDWDQSENEISRQIGEIRKRPTSLTRSQYTESTASASVSSASSAENEDILVPVDLGTHESDASYGDSKSTDSYMHNKGQLAFTQGGVEKSPQELKSLISPSQESQSLASVSSNENNDGLGCAHEHLHSIQEDNVQLDTAQDQLEEIHRQLTILYSQHSMFMESQHIDNSNESFSDSSTSSSTGSSETEQVSEDGPNHQNYSGEEKSQREQERLIPPSQQSQLTAHPTNPYSTAIQTDEKDISKNPYASYTWRKCMMIVFPLLVAAAFGFLLIFKPSTFSEDEGSTRDEAGINYDNPKGVSFHTSMGSITPPCTPFSIHLITDQFGNETSWNLLRLEEVNDENKTDKMENIAYIYDGSELRAYDGGGQVSHREDGQIRFLRSTKQVATESIKKSVIVMSGGPYSYQDEFERGATGDEYQMIDADICLPVGKYQFIIYDTEGDGMCCYYGHGKYGLHFPGGREVRPLSIGQFLGAHEVTAFEVTNTDINLANSEEDSQLQTGDDADLPIIYDVDSLTSFATASGNDLAAASLSKAFGIMFDVEMNSNVSSAVISGMDLYLDTTSSTHYEVWVKPGSWQNVDKTNPEYFKGFHQLSHGTIEGKGLCKANSLKSCAFSTIPIQDFQDITLSKGGAWRAAFYVTLNTDSMLLRNGEGSSKHKMANVVQSSNDEFQVFYGAGVLTYPLQFADPVTDVRNNKGFLGRLWYKDISKA